MFYWSLKCPAGPTRFKQAWIGVHGAQACSRQARRRKMNSTMQSSVPALPPSKTSQKGCWYSLTYSTIYVYAVILLQGLAQLISSGALLNSSHFFVSHVGGIGAQHILIMDYLLMVLCFSRLVFLLLSDALFKFFCVCSPVVHITYSLIAKTVIFLIFAWIAYQENLYGNVFLTVVLILSFLGSFMGVISFVGVYHFLATMRPIFSQALCIGQSSAGLVMSLVKVLVIIAAASSSKSSQSDPVVYFLITSIVTFTSALMFLTIVKSYKSAKFQFSIEPMEEKGDDIEEDQKRKPEDAATLHQPQPKRQSSHVVTLAYPRKNSSVHSLLLVRSFAASSPFVMNSPPPNQSKANLQEQRPTIENTLEPHELISGPKQLARVFLLHRWFYLCILVHYFQSLFLIPNFCYTTKAVHTDGVIYTKEMFPVFSYFIYHVAEWCGKLILSFDTVRCRNLKILWTGVIALFGVFPLFIMGNVPIITSNPILANDNFFFLLISIFGFIHGYISTCLVMLTPELQSATKDAVVQDKEAISTLVVYCISIGLLMGSIGSLLFKVVLLAELRYPP